MTSNASTKSVLTKVEIRYVPDAMIATVYGKALMGDIGAFLPVDQLELIDMPGFDHQKRPLTHPRNLETIYNHYQTIDRTDDERTTQLKTRAMTMGDAIVADGVAYYVGSEGFVTVVDGEITPVVTPEG